MRRLLFAAARSGGPAAAPAQRGPTAAAGLLQARAASGRGVLGSDTPGTEGSTDSASQPMRNTKEGDHDVPPEMPPMNPSVDSIRHMMGKANQAVGGDYEFPKTGGGTIRDMAREIGSNLARPLERAADAAGGAVMSAADAVTGAGETVANTARNVVGSHGTRAHDALSQNALEGDRIMMGASQTPASDAPGGPRETEGGGAGVHGLEPGSLDMGSLPQGPPGSIESASAADTGAGGEREGGGGGDREGGGVGGAQTMAAGGARGEVPERGASGVESAPAADVGRGGRGTGGVDGVTATP